MLMWEKYKIVYELWWFNLRQCKQLLYCIHTKKLSYLKGGVELDMDDILYGFKNLHHF